MNSDSTIAKLQEDLNKSGEHTLHEFTTLHTGKANTSMAENVTVEEVGLLMAGVGLEGEPAHAG